MNLPVAYVTLLPSGVRLKWVEGLRLLFGRYSLPILCTGFALYGPARYAWAQVMEREKAEEEPLF